jgi:hypothetical protein
MTILPENRRPLRADFRLSVAAPPSAPPWLTQTTSPISEPAQVDRQLENSTVKLDHVWSTVGNGTGGAMLDQVLTELGESYADGDRIVWRPPSDLDSGYAGYLLASVEQLNYLIRQGVVEVTEGGTIRPVLRPTDN